MSVEHLCQSHRTLFVLWRATQLDSGASCSITSFISYLTGPARYHGTTGPGVDCSSGGIAATTSFGKATTSKSPCNCYSSQPPISPWEISSLIDFSLVTIQLDVPSKPSILAWKVLLPTGFSLITVLVFVTSPQHEKQ